MKFYGKYSSLTTHFITALGISLVVNFSYLLLLIVDERDYGPPQFRNSEQSAVTEVRGVLRINPDGYGYLVNCVGDGIDSVYVQQWRMRNIDVSNGDLVEAEIVPPSRDGAHYRLYRIKSVNGEETDYGAAFNKPRYGMDAIMQIIYYLLFSLAVMVLMTAGAERRNLSFKVLSKRIFICTALTVGIYLFAPFTDRHTGRLLPAFLARTGVWFDTVVILKCTFTLVVSVLYAYIFTLIYQRQSIVLENERLKSENLTTRYDMLVSQINPHFFFNSLNSLAMLVRESDRDKALVYIDRMSYTFRYILQNGQNMMVTLREELKFAEAYSYLFKIRYEDKIFFDIAVDESYGDISLPSLSLQPLIDNAVKHNAITARCPMRISIRTENGFLVVSNPKYPLLKPAEGTGTGLKNLDSRWRLITGRGIEIHNEAETFTVKLPLQKTNG